MILSKNISFFIFVCSILLSVAYFKDPREVALTVESYTENYPQEKIYVHTDRLVYSPGEDIWFKVYLVNAKNHLSITPSQLVYVELLSSDKKIISSRNIYMDPEWAFGDFVVPKNSPDGKYLIRAFTDYMCNFDRDYIFEKEINIVGTSEKLVSNTSDNLGVVKLMFFPEGGEFIQGLNNTIAFKITEDNQPIEVVGQIIDDEEKVVNPLRTYYPGFGLFTITAERSKSYFAIFERNGKKYSYELPSPKEEGYIINVNNRSNKEVIVDISTNHPDGLANAYLIAHTRGNVDAIIEGFVADNEIVKIEKQLFKGGVSHLTLFDSNDKPRCERLIYIHHDSNHIDVKMTLPYSHFGLRQQANLTFNIDSPEIPYNSDCSISITDQFITPVNLFGDNIYNYFWLNSDLENPIVNPHYFFTDRSPKKAFILDMILMTNGWRRFKWDDILNNSDPEIKYAPSSGFTFVGKVMEKEEPYSGNLLVTMLSENFSVIPLISGASGQFLLDDINLFGPTDILIQLTDEKGEKINNNEKLKISLDEINKALSPDGNELGFYDSKSFDLNNFVLQSIENARIDSFYSQGFIVNLDEISITSDRITRDQELNDENNIAYPSPDNRIIVDSFDWIQPNYSVFRIVRMLVPGVEVQGTPYINQQFRIRGNSSISLVQNALVLVDGVEASNTYVNTLQAQDIQFIDVLKGLSKTSLYGERGAGGIVAIYTKRGKAKRRIKKHESLFSLNHPGYYKAREFYSPDYSEFQSHHQKPDYRTTLFWKPDISIDSTGVVSLSFYTGDRNTRYNVQLEGITDDGRVISKLFTFDVKK